MDLGMRSLQTTCILVALVITACATVSTERTRAAYEVADEKEPFPPFDGPVIPIQVVQFGIPGDIVTRYPELADKRIGWGLSNRLVETFYDARRFEFVEEKQAILNRIMDQWSLSETGIYFEDQPVGERPGLKAPQYLVYAEVYEFSVSHSEVLVGLAAEIRNTTIIGIQIRLVEVATGKFIPASGVGEAVTTGVSIWATTDLDFDQSTVGIASQQALNIAVRNLLKRMAD